MAIPSGVGGVEASEGVSGRNRIHEKELTPPNVYSWVNMGRTWRDVSFLTFWGGIKVFLKYTSLSLPSVYVGSVAGRQASSWLLRGEVGVGENAFSDKARACNPAVSKLLENSQN